MLIALLKWLLLIIAVEACVEIIVSTDITISIRKFFNYINPSFLGKLFSCGYCMSVWVSILFAWLLPVIFENCFIVDFFIKAIILHRLSNVFHEILSRLFNRIPWSLIANVTLDNISISNNKVDEIDIKELEEEEIALENSGGQRK